MTVADLRCGQDRTEHPPRPLKIVGRQSSIERREVDQRPPGIVTPQTIELLDDGVHGSESIP